MIELQAILQPDNKPPCVGRLFTAGQQAFTARFVPDRRVCSLHSPMISGDRQESVFLTDAADKTWEYPCRIGWDKEDGTNYTLTLDRPADLILRDLETAKKTLENPEVYPKERTELPPGFKGWRIRVWRATGDASGRTGCLYGWYKVKRDYTPSRAAELMPLVTAQDAWCALAPKIQELRLDPKQPETHERLEWDPLPRGYVYLDALVHPILVVEEI